MRKTFLFLISILTLSGCVTSQTRGGQPFTAPPETSKSVKAPAQNVSTNIRVALVPRKENPDLYEYHAQEVFPKTIYSKVGMKSGDILLSIDGKPVQTMSDVLDTPIKIGSGSFDQILVKRKGKNVVLKVKTQ